MQITKSNSSHANAKSQQKPFTLSTDIKQEELVRLMLQALNDLNYPILTGDWVLAERLMAELPFISHTLVSKAQFLIRQQKFLELLEKNETMQALYVLRNEITPLGENTDRLHQLSSLVLCSSVEDIMTQAQWVGSQGGSRDQLLVELQSYIESSAMIPKHRLVRLINQAIEWQKCQCLYHSPLKNSEFSLFSDHVCTSGSYCAWSPDDTRLLICGTDNAIRVWNPHTSVLEQILVQHKDQVTSCVWLPDSVHFITGSCDKKMLLWSIHEGAPISRWNVQRTTDMKITQDGKRLVTIGLDKCITLYAVDAMKITEVGKITEEGTITSLSITKKGDFALVNIQHLQEIHLWDLNQLKLVHKYSGQKQNEYIIRSTFGGPDESFILSGSEEGHESTVNCVSWCPIEPIQYVSAGDDHTIRV
ncbi:WD40-repeat-containing domain protein [Sporodiniella umbellata]|nr:WD40-repeat-containing domain protein [Sporodiniella umbellata]